MKKYIVAVLMMFLVTNITLARNTYITVEGNEQQEIMTHLNNVISSDDIVVLADTTPILSKRALRRQRVAKRNLHYNILGGPSYTPDFGLLVGGSALMTFRMNPSDTTQRRSVVPMAIALMFKGGLNLMTKPQLFFKSDHFRIFGTFSYKNTLENFYGIGYMTNKDYERGKETSEYRYSGIQLNPWFLFRLGKSDFFAGPQIDFNYDKITKPAPGLVEQPSYIAAGGTEQGYSNQSSGLGFLLTYDTRDIPANAYKGIYLDFRGMIYNKAFGGDNNFYRLEIDYRQYKSLGHRRVLAWTTQTKNVFGNVPLTKYVLSGTPFDLRGYYMGQYRDKSSHVVMVEYRQMINTDKSTWMKKMLSHVGYVAWGGCGFMGPTPGKIEGVLPNLGVGIRIEVQPRMNVRLDFGRNMVNKQNLFYFNMTEAF
ncbi:Surface antigen [Bacteroides faecichinchillae]|uniref:Surface antigen n=2 Tax=Bacteroides faecichinchillae TaxID=871325 RepID=A0A1M5F1K3_9BACE|nr:Surface antigen [Bacteroides faecichinchillae]